MCSSDLEDDSDRKMVHIDPPIAFEFGWIYYNACWSMVQAFIAQQRAAPVMIRGGKGRRLRKEAILRVRAVRGGCH